MSTRVIARRYTLEVPEPAAPGCTVWRGRDSTNGGAVVVSLLDEHPEADTTLNALVAVRQILYTIELSATHASHVFQARRCSLRRMLPRLRARSHFVCARLVLNTIHVRHT